MKKEREKEYYECIKEGGTTCSYCNETIDCNLDNNVYDYYCSEDCYYEATYDPSDIYYRR
jgi:hypothetical protein